MSTALLSAIGDRLDGTETFDTDSPAEAAQSALISLLGKDRDAQGQELSPSVVQGIFDEEVEMPQVTFRLSGGIPHPLSGTDTAVIHQPFVDIEVWSDSRSGTLLPDICDLVEQLLDDRRGIAPVFSLPDGYHAVTMECMSGPSVLYDSQRNASFALTRYRAIEQRYKGGV